MNCVCVFLGFNGGENYSEIHGEKWKKTNCCPKKLTNSNR